MKRVLAVAGLTALLVAMGAGCRKHHRRQGHGGDDRGWPEANWPAGQMTVNEGSTFTVVLTLDQSWDTPVDIELSSTDTSRVTLPATVTFPAGVTTRNVTISTIADADSSDTFVQVRAESLLDVNLMGIVLRETGAPLGGALGPVTVGPNRAVLVTDGPDGLWSTADDTLAVASGVGAGVPAITHVTIGAVTPGPHALPVVTGVSDTVLVMTNGPDLTLGTSDDTVVEVDSISGATPAVSTSLVVGRLEASEGRRPVMVGTRGAWMTRGADLVTSADDQFVVLDGIGSGTLTLSSNTLTGVAFEAPGILTVIDSVTVTTALSGGDFLFGTPDDQLVIITGIGGALTGTTLGTFPQFPGRMGMSVRIGPTTIVTAYVGGDSTPGTVDDVLVVWHDILTLPVPLFFPTGAISMDPDAQPVTTGGDTALLPLRGADLTDFTADDQVAHFTSLSTPIPPAPVNLAAAFPVPGAAGRITALSSTTAVRIHAGADGSLGTADDSLVLLASLTGVGSSSTFPTGPLQNSAPLAFTSTSVVAVGEGDDGVSGNADDAVLVVSGIGTSPALASALPGPFRLSGTGALVPDGATSVLLARTAGSDSAPGTADDVLSTSSLP